MRFQVSGPVLIQCVFSSGNRQTKQDAVYEPLLLDFSVHASLKMFVVFLSFLLIDT